MSSSADSANVEIVQSAQISTDNFFEIGQFGEVGHHVHIDYSRMGLEGPPHFRESGAKSGNVGCSKTRDYGRSDGYPVVKIVESTNRVFRNYFLDGGHSSISTHRITSLDAFWVVSCGSRSANLLFGHGLLTHDLGLVGYTEGSQRAKSPTRLDHARVVPRESTGSSRPTFALFTIGSPKGGHESGAPHIHRLVVLVLNQQRLGARYHLEHTWLEITVTLKPQNTFFIIIKKC